MFFIQRTSAGTLDRIKNLLEFLTQYVLVWYTMGESNPSFAPWKGAVLTVRRMVHINALNFLKNFLLISQFMDELYQNHTNCQDFFKLLPINNMQYFCFLFAIREWRILEWVTGLEPAWFRFAICCLTIQRTPTLFWPRVGESNPVTYFHKSTD